NGLALHGGITKPYSATFLTFSDYMRGAIRLGSLMNLPVVYVFTHDSIGLGEDGPTHQSVEHVAALSTIPNLAVFRPADANETAAAWHTAMTLPGPATLIFTRQNVPVLAGDHIRAGVARGGYVLADSDGTPDVILVSRGSEVHIALEAYHTLTAQGVKARVVSLPSWQVFEAQDAAYRNSVLPPQVTARVSIEAGITMGWERYVGSQGVMIGVNRYGASAPYEIIYEQFGLTADAVVQAARGLLK
ncbi:MAG: transketolase, partial [Anaerolineae bacterium]|nr:transketolase [Anaerolineae bacterium]